MKIKLIALLLIVHILKELVWLAVIPIWHFPDEEQHFGQTAFYVEKGSFPHGRDLDINREIDQSSEILGTKRNSRGMNKFTYHPEYRTPYLKAQIGLYEQKIKALNIPENRETMVKHEAARYGPAYYFLSAIPYKLFYSGSLLSRVFASRFISLILSTLTVLITYLIAGEIFSCGLLKLSLAFLVSFQPMFSFVSAGINSDNLFNLIFSLILYTCLKIFFPKKKRPFWESMALALLLIISLIIGFYTKKQIFIVLPIILSAFLFSFLAKNKKNKKQYFFILGLFLAFFLIFTKGKIKIPEYNPNASSKLKETFFQYIFWHFQHTIAETIPWYWGVFNWLGKTLPRFVLRIQARMLIISAVGFLVYFFKQIKKKALFNNKNLKIFFLLAASAIYYFAIITWDFFFHQGHSFSFGIQGRYFFPTIASHMLFIILGLFTLIPRKFKFIGLKAFLCWWMFFSFIGLKTAVEAYYRLWPINTFLNQVSQYKPLIFKAYGFSIISLAFLFTSVILLVRLLKFNETKNR